MTDKAEQMAVYMKKKATSQASFTRTVTSMEKLLANPTVPVATLQKAVEDLHERFKVFEDTCDEILFVVEEGSDTYSEVDSLIAKKYDILNDIRAQVDVKVQASDSVSTASAVDSAANTAELVKSFQASLTLPKPQFRKFNGDPAHYATFIAYIETYVERNVIDEQQRLSFIIDSCSDVAHDSISFLAQCSNSSQAYAKAKSTLKELFGGKHQINRAIINECTSGGVIKPNDMAAMRSLVIALRRAEVTLEESGSPEELTSTDKLVRIYQRLPRFLQHKWTNNLLDISGKPSFATMRRLVERYIASTDNEYCVYESEPVNPKARKPVFTVSSTSNHSCCQCKGEHYLNQCPEFLKLDLKAKYDVVSSKQLCRNCLHSGHIASKCPRKGFCRKCSSKHNDVLHDDKYQSRVSHTDVNNSASNVNAFVEKPVYNVSKPGQTTGLSCVDVVVEGKNAFYKCKAIVDRKSSVNLCTNKLASKLGLESVPFETMLNVAAGNFTVKGQRLHESNVFTSDMKDYVVARDVLAVDKIPLSMDAVFNQDDISGLSHLEGVQIPLCSMNNEIDLLIGSGVPKAFHQYEERKGKDDEIYAVRQTLGWDLVGPKRKGSNESSAATYFTSSPFAMSDIDSPVEYLSHVFNSDFKDFSLFSQKTCPSIEDIEALQLVEKSTVLENGKFCVGIPWKQNPSNLPSSKSSVLKRLNGLKKRFEKDAELLTNYRTEMQKFIDNHFLERSTEDDTDLCHYIPHHPVFHPRKRTLRIVWDCAVSLNDFIYEGPDLLNSLVEVLIRFRRFKFVVCSDIRKMYLNVNMPPNDRGAFRILWWPDGNTSADPVEYRAAVHIYGAKSSGFIANHCVKKLAKEVKDPFISDVMLNDLYVDDQISSVSTKEAAVALVEGTRNVLKEGGFHLTKFVSNCSEAIDSLPDCDRVDSVDLSLGDSAFTHSTLGLRWIVDSDELVFPCSVPTVDQITSRRVLLSTIAKAYDPLGAIAPVILPLKILMQEKSDLDWDATDDDMCQRMSEFRETIHLVSQFKVRRCYKPVTDNFDNPVNVSLHGFSDASSQGYSAVVYIRQVATNGQTSVSFVLGKAKVAPKFKGHIPQATIPKLELNAAALLIKLIQKVKQCIDITIDEIMYWCDSQAVISCIRSTDKRFPVYWSNRLAIIHGSSQVDQWRFVPTKQNAADVGSRGVYSKDFNRSMYLWINGPPFLLLQPEEWPTTPDVPIMENVMMMSGAQRDASELLSHIITYYSSLPKLLRVIARLMRFMAKVKNNDKNDIPLDLETAKVTLIRYEQMSLDNSQLKRLKPFKDEIGLTRVQSRLANAKHLTYDERFPIILPKNSHLTKLLIQDEHSKSAHMGANYVLSMLRKSYCALQKLSKYFTMQTTWLGKFNLKIKMV